MDAYFHGKVDVATERREHEAWRKFILLTGPKEQGHYKPCRATTSHAGPQGKCPGFDRGGEDRGKGLV